MYPVQPMEPRTALVTVVIAFFITTVAFGVGRTVIDTPVAPDSERMAVVDTLAHSAIQPGGSY